MDKELTFVDLSKAERDDFIKAAKEQLCSLICSGDLIDKFFDDLTAVKAFGFRAAEISEMLIPAIIAGAVGSDYNLDEEIGGPSEDEADIKLLIIVAAGWDDIATFEKETGIKVLDLVNSKRQIKDLMKK